MMEYFNLLFTVGYKVFREVEMNLSIMLLPSAWNEVRMCPTIFFSKVKRLTLVMYVFTRVYDFSNGKFLSFNEYLGFDCPTGSTSILWSLTAGPITCLVLWNRLKSSNYDLRTLFHIVKIGRLRWYWYL